MHILTLLHHHLAFASVNVYQPCHIMPSSARAARGFLKSNWDSSIKMRPPSIESMVLNLWFLGSDPRPQVREMATVQGFKTAPPGHLRQSPWRSRFEDPSPAEGHIQYAISRTSGRSLRKETSSPGRKRPIFIYRFHIISLFHCIFVNFH